MSTRDFNIGNEDKVVSIIQKEKHMVSRDDIKSLHMFMEEKEWSYTELLRVAACLGYADISAKEDHYAVPEFVRTVIHLVYGMPESKGIIIDRIDNVLNMTESELSNVLPLKRE